jgi:hypothetical protein
VPAADHATEQEGPLHEDEDARDLLLRDAGEEADLFAGSRLLDAQELQNVLPSLASRLGLRAWLRLRRLGWVLGHQS